MWDVETFLGVARRVRPDLDAAGVIPRSTSDGPSNIEQGVYSIDASKAKRELTLKRTYLDSFDGDVR